MIQAGGRIRIDFRIGVDQAGAHERQGSAALQVADGEAGSGHAFGYIVRAGAVNEVGAGGRQALQEGDVVGNEFEIVPAQRGQDEKDIDRPGMVSRPEAVKVLQNRSSSQTAAGWSPCAATI